MRVELESKSDDKKEKKKERKKAQQLWQGANFFVGYP